MQSTSLSLFELGNNRAFPLPSPPSLVNVSRRPDNRRLNRVWIFSCKEDWYILLKVLPSHGK
jgi:hypothetical protein